jgi:hypothetical protein
MNMDYCKPPKAFPSRSENPHLPRSKLVASAGRDPGTLGPSGVVSNVALEHPLQDGARRPPR